MKDTHVIMTAMPPTTGHRDLIEFACQYTHQIAPHGNVYVHLTACEDEPFIVERSNALAALCRGVKWCTPTLNVVTYPVDMAQTPEQWDGDESEFWSQWCGLIWGNEPSQADWWDSEDGTMMDGIIIGSETYCQKFADHLGWEFVPYDMGRDINSTSASYVRGDLTWSYGWSRIVPEFRSQVNQNFVFFGAESVGKTSISKKLASWNSDYTWYPEWARPYLEHIGRDLTPEKMDTIANAQFAIDKIAHSSAQLATLQDTDIYSTIGYYRLYEDLQTDLYRELETKLALDASWRKFHNKDKPDWLPTTTYIVLQQDHVPFEADPLRYGGIKRETTDQYWIDILEEFGLNYVVCPPGDKEETFWWCSHLIDSIFEERFAPLRDYKRRS